MTVAEVREADGRTARNAGVVLVASTAASLVAIAGLTWWSTRLGGETLSMLLSVVIAVTGAALVGRVGRRATRGARLTAVVVTLAVGAAFLVLSTSGILVRAKVRGHLAGWTDAAEQALAAEPTGGSRCEAEPVGPLELPAFGRIDQQCVNATPGHRLISFNQKDAMGGWTGLLYSPDAAHPDVMSQCLAHLDGPWWQTSSALPDCPTGFTFQGGG